MRFRWRRIRTDFWECWGIGRAEVSLWDFGWLARLRHGSPQHVGRFGTLRAARLACEREFRKQRAGAIRRRREAAAFVREILADNEWEANNGD